MFRTASRGEAQEAYALYVNDLVAKNERVDLASHVLGDTRFVAAFKDVARRCHDELPLPHAVVALGRPSLAELFAGVGSATPRRDHAIAKAHVEHAYRLSEIASFLQVDPSIASKALRRHESRRN